MRRWILLGWVLAMALPASSQVAQRDREFWPGLNSDSFADENGDGLYEWALLDGIDWDGDGTRWHTCECGAATTPANSAAWVCGNYHDDVADNPGGGSYEVDHSAGDAASEWPECRFDGERIWDDFMDDFNALQKVMAPGGIIQMSEGVYLFKGIEDTSLDCWDSTTRDYDDVCQTYVGPFGTETNRSAAAMIKKSGLRVIGAGQDPDGEMDFQRSGTWIALDPSAATAGGDDNHDSVIRSIGVGFSIGGTGVGNHGDHGDSIVQSNRGGADILLDELLNRSTTSVTHFQVCVCNNTTGGDCTASTDEYVAAAGGINKDDDVMLQIRDRSNVSTAGFYAKVLSDPGGTGNCGTVAGTTCSVADNCGILVNLGLNPTNNAWDQALLPNVFDASDQGSTLNLFGPLRKDWQIVDAYWQDLTIAPQDYLFSSADCGAEDEADCDQGGATGIMHGIRSGFRNVSLMHGSRDSSLATTWIDGSVEAIEPTMEEINVAYGNFNTSMADPSQSARYRGWTVHDNLFTNTGATTLPAIKTFGGWIWFDDFLFYNNASRTTSIGTPLLDLNAPFIKATNIRAFGNSNMNTLSIGAACDNCLVDGLHSLGNDKYHLTITGSDTFPPRNVTVQNSDFGLGGQQTGANSDAKVLISNAGLTRGFVNLTLRGNRAVIKEGNPQTASATGCFVNASDVASTRNVAISDLQMYCEDKTLAHCVAKPFCGDLRANAPVMGGVNQLEMRINNVNYQRTVKAYTRHPAYTLVAGLPTCDATNVGQAVLVTDEDNEVGTAGAGTDANCDGNGAGTSNVGCVCAETGSAFRWEVAW